MAVSSSPGWRTACSASTRNAWPTWCIWTRWCPNRVRAGAAATRPETQQARIDAAAPSGGLSFPPPDAAVFGLDGADRDWVNRRQTPQPFSVYQQPLHFDATRVAALPRTFIDCTAPALPTIAASRVRVRSEPGWQVLEMKTGHDPMVSEPQALADLLLRVHQQATRSAATQEQRA